MVSDVGVNTKVITLPCAISDDGEQRPYGEWRGGKHTEVNTLHCAISDAGEQLPDGEWRGG